MLSQRREVKRLGGAAGVLATVERMMYEDASSGGSGGGGQHVQMAAAAKIADATLRWSSPRAAAMAGSDE